MGLELQQATLNFDSTSGSKQKLDGSVSFSRPVRAANAVQCAVKGFNIRYTGSNEHPLHELEIDIDGPTIRANDRRTIDFSVDFGLRDGTGNFDDAYKGWVQIVAIADTQ